MPIRTLHLTKAISTIYNFVKSYLSIILQLEYIAVLIFEDQRLRFAFLQLYEQREVTVDVVVREHIATRAWEGEVTPVECKDVLTVHYYCSHCGHKKYLHLLV